jgi:hypothetical protein
LLNREQLKESSVRKFVQNLLAATIVLGAASSVYAQYNTRPSSSGYGRGTSTPSSSSGSYYGGSTYTSSASYGYENEFITNFTRGYLFSGKTTKNGESQTDIVLSGKYLRNFNSNIQLGGLAEIDSVSGGGRNSETLLTLVGVGVYNFDMNFKQAFFAEAGIGIYPVPKESAPGHESKFGFYIGGGKRFPLWDRINYIPTIELIKKGDLDIAFDIQFLNFSIMF